MRRKFYTQYGLTIMVRGELSIICKMSELAKCSLIVFGLIGLSVSLAHADDKVSDWFTTFQAKSVTIDYQENHESLQFPPSVEEALHAQIYVGKHVQKIYIDVQNRRLALILSPVGQEPTKQLYVNGVWHTFSPRQQSGIVEESNRPIQDDPRLYSAIFRSNECQKSIRPAEKILGVETSECTHDGNTFYFWQQILLKEVPVRNEHSGAYKRDGSFVTTKLQSATSLRFNESIPDDVFVIPLTRDTNYQRYKKAIHPIAFQGGMHNVFSPDSRSELKVLLQIRAAISPSYRPILANYLATFDVESVKRQIEQFETAQLAEAAKNLGAPGNIVNGDAQTISQYLDETAEGQASQALRKATRDAIAEDRPKEAIANFKKLLAYYPTNRRMNAFYVRLLEQDDEFSLELLNAYNNELLYVPFSGTIPMSAQKRLILLSKMGKIDVAKQELASIIEFHKEGYSKIRQKIIAVLEKEAELSPDQRNILAKTQNSIYQALLHSNYQLNGCLLLASNDPRQAVEQFRATADLYDSTFPVEHLSWEETIAYQRESDALLQLAFVELLAKQATESLISLDKAEKVSKLLTDKNQRVGRSISSQLLRFQAQRQLGNQQEMEKALTAAATETTSSNRQGGSAFDIAQYDRFVSEIKNLAESNEQSEQFLCSLKEQGTLSPFRRREFFWEINDLSAAIASRRTKSGCWEEARAIVQSATERLTAAFDADFPCGYSPINRTF